jgi:CelD/BcsL family acetyltransferase involved in cellulose biosynthesis
VRPLTRSAPTVAGPPTVVGRPTVRVLRTAAEVDAACAAWDSGVAAGALGPLTRPAWFAAAAATLAPPGRLRVVVVEEDGAVVAAAPLVVAPDERLELLGADVLPEPGDVAARDAATLAILAHAVVALRRPVRLARVPVASPTVAALRAAAGRGGLVATRPADGWPTLTLDPGWAAPQGRLSSRRAGDLRRAARRADAAGGVEVTHHRPAPADVDGLLALALRVEAAGWKGRTRTALLHDPVRRAFFRDWARRAARDGTLRVGVLRIDGAPAAVQIAAESAGRWWILKIGHGDEHARCSPGLLLLLATVRHAARRGLDAVELLGTVEPWTTAWTTEASATCVVRLYPGNAAGARRLARDGTRAVARRAARARQGGTREGGTRGDPALEERARADRTPAGHAGQGRACEGAGR